MILLISLASHADSNYIFYGTSRKVLSMIDKRKPDAAIVIRNEAMVNALHVYHSGSMVMTGDSAGNLKTWDIRSPQQVLIG